MFKCVVFMTVLSLKKDEIQDVARIECDEVNMACPAKHASAFEVRNSSTLTNHVRHVLACAALQGRSGTFL